LDPLSSYASSRLHACVQCPHIMDVEAKFCSVHHSAMTQGTKVVRRLKPFVKAGCMVDVPTM
jgi:hypothetical protein